MTINNPLNKKHLPFGNAASIRDEKTLMILDRHVDSKILFQENLHEQFVTMYIDWIKSTSNNTLIGLDDFNHACFSNGTTESFDKFYMKNNKSRFRCFKGEYVYHQLAWRNHWPSWKYIEDEALAEGDAVVISLPFSDTGNKHDKLDWLLEQCCLLNIPVLLDCAYFGICNDIIFDFNYSCITDVTFSLSKTFPVAHARIGMRLTRTNDDDPLFVSHSNGYVNRYAAHLGMSFLRSFGPDYIFNKYRKKQINFCNRLEVTPSQTVLFGIGGKEWNAYNRGRETNRLSFHKYLSLNEQVFYDDHDKK